MSVSTPPFKDLEILPTCFTIFAIILRVIINHSLALSGFDLLLQNVLNYISRRASFYLNAHMTQFMAKYKFKIAL